MLAETSVAESDLDDGWPGRSGPAAPLSDKVLRGFRPGGELEVEAGLEQARRDDAAALQYELRFGAQEERAEFEERRRGGEAVGHAIGLAQRGHELAVGQRVRGGDVDRAVDAVAGDEEFDGAREVERMHPGDELASVALAASEAEAHEVEQDGESAAGIGAHDD